MSLPKNKIRNITVENVRYHWIASGNDGIINVIVCLEENSGQKLLASFAYNQKINNNNNIETKITPLIIEKLIKYALNLGWIPNLKGKDLNLFIIEFSQLGI